MHHLSYIKLPELACSWWALTYMLQGGLQHLFVLSAGMQLCAHACNGMQANTHLERDHCAAGYWSLVYVPGLAPELLVFSWCACVCLLQGNTPLHYAAGYGRPQLVELLLTRGANKAAKNDSGKTAYDLAT